MNNTLEYDDLYDDLYEDYFICPKCGLKVYYFDKQYHMLSHNTNYFYCPLCLNVVYYYEHAEHMQSHNTKCCIIL